MGAKKQQKKSKSKTNRKYLFVTGGVMSGIGKGIATASIGTMLEARGLKVTAIKIDPYINVDAGTMNPTEHGEVFVLDDGYETDQDMGNYERFLDVTLPSINYMTTGVVYQEVIRRERNLEYKGKNVEVVPDIPLEVIRRIEAAADGADADVTIVEVGGTIGEYQNILFIEALRMMKTKMPADVFTVMVSYLPVPGHVGEMKTKPTQYAARSLNAVGVQADIIIARGEVPIDEKRKQKIATFCNVKPQCVISAPDVKSIYDVPLNFMRDKLDETLCELMGLPCNKKAELSAWKRFVNKSKNTKGFVNIAVIGKYFNSGDFLLSDVYISVLEAIKFSGYKLGVKPKITYLSSSEFEQKGANFAQLKKFDGVLVPGGFGTTGIEGKIKVIEYVRKHNIPYFGLCYGMQLAVIEYARNVAKIKNASTHEITPNGDTNVIDIMPEQKEKVASGDYGGTMRLGSYPAHIKPGTHAYAAYKDETISERHRHRYEVNPKYIDQIQDAGMVFSGTSPDGRLMEIAELPKKVHPFFVGVQFHPELLARPMDPHPLFTAFIKAAKHRK